jgi:hypothetical protein
MGSAKALRLAASGRLIERGEPLRSGSTMRLSLFRLAALVVLAVAQVATSVSHAAIFDTRATHDDLSDNVRRSLWSAWTRSSNS